MKLFCFVIALVLSTVVSAALPGVTELRSNPEQVTDAQLSALLGARVGGADVVALGETVHGSAEFLRIQARLIRYLAENHGHRLIVWEIPPLRGRELAQWVASCATARSEPPIAALYFPTRSDLALWEWMCAFNRSNPHDAILFRGMDIWDRPWEHYARIRSLGARAGLDSALFRSMEASCPAYQASSWPEIEAVLGLVGSNGRFVPEADYARCRAVLTALLNTARQSGLDRRSSMEAGADDAFELAISASTLLGWLGFYNYNWSDDMLSWNERDRAQGRNLMLVMEQHGAKRAILAAHTSHTTHNRSPADWWGYGDIKSGVYFFTELTRKRVFNIAFTAYEASGAQGSWSVPAATSSLDRKLHEAGHAFAFFSSGAEFLSEHPKWWMQNQNAPPHHENGVELVPRDHFDAFFFFDRSHLDQALPARPVWQP